MYLFLNKKQAELQEGGCFHTARNGEFSPTPQFPIKEANIFPLNLGWSFPACFATRGVTIVYPQGNKSWGNCVLSLGIICMAI